MSSRVHRPLFLYPCPCDHYRRNALQTGKITSGATTKDMKGLRARRYENVTQPAMFEPAGGGVEHGMLPPPVVAWREGKNDGEDVTIDEVIHIQ